jgi:hypothetical protein
MHRSGIDGGGTIGRFGRRGTGDRLTRECVCIRVVTTSTMNDGVLVLVQLDSSSHETLVIELLGRKPTESFVINDDGEWCINEIVLKLICSPYDGDSEAFLLGNSIVLLGIVELATDIRDRMFTVFVFLTQHCTQTTAGGVGL